MIRIKCLFLSLFILSTEKNHFSATITNVSFPVMSIVIVIAETSFIEPEKIYTNIGMLLSDENSITILICGGCISFEL
jgi:hypothetical protein